MSLVFGRNLCLALALVSAACATEAPCLEGARVCSGTVVMLCDPQTGTFVEEYRCPPGSDCVAGKCLGAQFRPTDAQEADVDDADGPLPTPDTTTATPDTSPPTPDTSIDSGAPDTAPTPDTTPSADTALSDTSPGDVTGGDTALSDTTPTPDVPEPAGPDTPDVDNAPSGVLIYTPIPNIALQDDISRVAWHPSGDYALLLGTKGQVARVDVAKASVEVLTTLGKEVTDLDVSLSGDYFVIVGRDGDDKGMLWRYDPVSGDVETVVIPSGIPAAIVREPGTARVAIGARHGNNINMLYTYDPTSGLSPPKGYNGYGVRDLMWGDPSLTPGSANVVTSDGVNGAGSQTWILASNLVVANGWPGSFGNPGGAAWQPNGGYGLLTGTSSNKVYVYAGSWTKSTLPVGTAASPNAVAWRSDGKRALIVGRAIGSPLTATVIEHRPGVDGAFTPTFVDQGILAFDGAPFFGHGSMHLLDIAWRPNTACDEGFIVGSDKGSAFSPAFGLVIHFYDAGDPACAPLL